MADKTAEIPHNTIEDIRKLFLDWEFLVTGQGYKFDVLYFDNHLDSNGFLTSQMTAMEVFQDWKYKRAKIGVNMHVCTAMEDYELEETVVHELVHILIGPCESDDARINERVTTEIAFAILKTRVK